MPTRVVKNLANSIYCSVENGECLYEKDMFDDLIKNIEKLKSFCAIEFNNNQEPGDEE